MEHKDWEHLSPDEEAEIDAWEETLLNQIRQLQAEDAQHDKVRILNPNRMKDIETALKKFKVVLKTYLPEATVSVGVQKLSKAGYISISLPENFETTNVAAFCDALSAVDHAEISIAHGKIYLDASFFGLTQTEYLN